jgi:hypothetical protein
MSKFYFTTPDDREYELSSTSSIKVSEAAVITKSPVESGKSIVDNYYLDNKIITFSGVITNVSVSSQPANRKRDVGRWIDEIRILRLQKALLVVHYDSFQIVRNCVITMFDITKTKEEGASGWRCDMTFQEVEISERARLVSVPEAKVEVKNETDPLNEASSSNKVQVGDELSTTVTSDIVVAVGQGAGRFL